MAARGGKQPLAPELAATIRESGELRQDLVSGKWVIVATGRASRPQKEKEKKALSKLPKYKDNCPFCNLSAYPQAPDVICLPDDPERWQFHIFENKYPALLPKKDYRSWRVGPHNVVEAVGYHELLAPRWHNQTEWNMTETEVAVMLEALVLRYRQLRTQSSVNYIQIIRNHGPAAGASLEHPHHQMFALPVIPDEVHDKLLGSGRYFQANDKEVFEEMLRFEMECGDRVVYEDDAFVAFCPYASRVSYEVWIMPKNPSPYFENIGPVEREGLATALRTVLTKLYTALDDPALNYVVYSAPCDDAGGFSGSSIRKSYRWHVSIMPRLSTWGGFEVGTGLEIIEVTPEKAAEILRETPMSGID